VFPGGGAPLIGSQEEPSGPNEYTPRGFHVPPTGRRGTKYGFSGFMTTNKQTKKARPQLVRLLPSSQAQFLGSEVDNQVLAILFIIVQ